MTPFKILAICFLIFGCSTTELVENWKNPDIEQYNPNKVLLVGMTANLDARQQFEQQLQEEYKVRGIEAVMSSTYFEPTFTSYKKTEIELLALEGQLIMDGFDTILFTKVIGVEDNIIYSLTNSFWIHNIYIAFPDKRSAFGRANTIHGCFCMIHRVIFIIIWIIVSILIH